MDHAPRANDRVHPRRAKGNRTRGRASPALGGTTGWAQRLWLINLKATLTLTLIGIVPGASCSSRVPPFPS